MGRATVFTEAEREKGFALFNQEESTNSVAKKLFGGNYAKAKKLRDEYDAQKEPANDTEPIDADAAPASWTVSLEVPTEKMDEILLRFTPQEKADAIATVLQNRLNVEG